MSAVGAVYDRALFFSSITRSGCYEREKGTDSKFDAPSQRNSESVPLTTTKTTAIGFAIGMNVGVSLIRDRRSGKVVGDIRRRIKLRGDLSSVRQFGVRGA
jgi:hypothetical protein